MEASRNRSHLLLAAELAGCIAAQDITSLKSPVRETPSESEPDSVEQERLLILLSDCVLSPCCAPTAMFSGTTLSCRTRSHRHAGSPHLLQFPVKSYSTRRDHGKKRQNESRFDAACTFSGASNSILQ